MFRALFIKELREIWWLGLLPLVFVLYAVSQEASYNFWQVLLIPRSPDRWDKMPFDGRSLTVTILQWGCILAGVLGLWQTFRESHSHTWHFLLHRPVDRDLILKTKVLAAGTVYALVIVVPVLGLTLWAATPGTHPSPFHWSLTIPVWYAVAAGTAVYLAGLFAGLRQGHLLGSRWWPLIGAAVVLALGLLLAPRPYIPWLAMLLLLWDVLLTAAIRAELKAGDFN